MPRERKDSKVLNINLSTQVYDQLGKFCEETGMTKTTATEKILGQFFDEYFSRAELERKIFK